IFLLWRHDLLVIKDTVDFLFNYDLNKFGPVNEILFFDIETTGFSRKYNYIYLIGCMYIENNTTYIVQFFAESKEDEINILKQFKDLLSNHKIIIQFNGNAFDLPFVEERCSHHDIDLSFDDCVVFDIYKAVKPYSKLLKINNLKQKSLEFLLNITRTDQYSGGDLIPVYEDYQKNKSREALDKLLLHNYEDVYYMGQLVTLFALKDMFNGQFIVSCFETDTYSNYDGISVTEIKIDITLDSPIPFHISHKNNLYYIVGNEDKLKISINILDGELKYFFSDYKNYYYLPFEDMAMHKDVSSFIDKDHRKQATAATCYIKKQSLFVPIIGTEHINDTSLTKRLFKTDYKDSLDYIEYCVLSDDNIHNYVVSLLSYI
ncbi:MAG: ribonuclease H-like domain-containing protein, partial [Lachnospiraceae bacterium]|nr:ribonuclease H-like domain-containing protein [Lachnospiraceae bacterium]